MIPKFEEIVNSQRGRDIGLFLTVFLAILTLFGGVFLLKTTHNTQKGINVEYGAFEPNFRATSTMPYMASSGGEVYYPIACSSGNRINPKNRIYLESIAQAEGLGYRKSSRCAY